MESFMEKLNTNQRKEVQRQMEIYSQGAEKIIPQKELEEKIARSVFTNEPLKIKLGLDPSAPDVHLGHTVVINKLKQFQDNGHTIQLLIGDFTGRIGDPTGKSVVRKQLTEKEVKRNAETYFEQFAKVIDMEKVELHYNSKWLSKLNFEDVINLAGKITVSRLMERDDFENRLQTGKPISLHEFFYPLMQGYDSVELESDIELGGTDQHFNVLMGRHFQEKFGKEKQVVILMPLLEGLDGVEKMSKSKNNYIGVNESPQEMFGKVMSLPDELMVKYLELATDFPRQKIQKMKEDLRNETLHPRDAKVMLAKNIVRIYHDEEKALEAEKQFILTFSKKQIPVDIPEVVWEGEQEVNIIDLVVKLGLLQSKSEVRRMIANRGIRINGNKVVEDIQLVVQVKDDMVLQIGKRKFAKLKINNNN